MNPTVKCFDEKKASEELKKCPKIVRDYVKLLKQHKEKQKELTDSAIRELKKYAKSPKINLNQIFEIEGAKYIATKPNSPSETNDHGQIIFSLYPVS